MQTENKLKKLKQKIKNDSSYFKGKIHFEEDGAQNYLVFQGVYKYFEDVNVSKLLLNFMLIHGYQKHYLMKKLVLLLELNLHLYNIQMPE